MAVMLIGLFGISSVYAANDASDDDTTKLIMPGALKQERFEVVNRPLIAGLWAMTIPKQSCLEYYNFKEDGQFVVRSREEWATGFYDYTLPDVAEMGTTLPQLVMSFKYDNHLPDCQGNITEQLGEAQRQYVRWVDSSHIQFCATESGEQCLLNLRKILP